MPRGRSSRIMPETQALLYQAWRQHRKLDVLGHIEESLSHDQTKLVEAFLAWLKANPDQKTGRDHLDATLEAFYASRPRKKKSA